jgi:hypothetical protein
MLTHASSNLHDAWVQRRALATVSSLEPVTKEGCVACLPWLLAVLTLHGGEEDIVVSALGVALPCAEYGHLEVFRSILAGFVEPVVGLLHSHAGAPDVLLAALLLLGE